MIRYFNKLYSRKAWMIVILACFGVAWLFISAQKTESEKATGKYIAAFSQQAYERAGNDFFNPRYSPERLGKPLEQLDTTYDFDFSWLNEVEQKLVKVDRPQALKAIFEIITRDARTDTERHLALLAFLQQAAFNSTWMQPTHENKQAVMDPLVLLELGIMRCGQVARVAADLFQAAGYPTRLVQVAHHVSAEVYYGEWHLLEADMIQGGMAPLIEGMIPSVEKMSRAPASLDRLPFNLRVKLSNEICHRNNSELIYPSYYFFSRHAYESSGNEPLLYYKTATPEQAKTSIWYGWNYWRTEPDNNRLLTASPPKYEPTMPKFKSVVIADGKAKIAWEASQDYDNDLIGYRVYVSAQSRGWNYNQLCSSPAVRPYWDGGWKPEMYSSLYSEPPSEISLLQTRETEVEIDLPPGARRFITVMPYDQYGESIGRRIWWLTEELVLSTPE
jgi:hypothetical protein